MAKKTARKGGRATTKKKAQTKELVPLDATAEALIPRTQQSSLAAWFELYMAIEAGPEDSNTFRAKRRDLQAFLD